MSLKVRCAVALAGGVGAVGLLLPLHGGAAAAAPWPVLLVLSSGVLLLAILYGHATGCPCCEWWWARREGETEFVDREVFDKGGVPFGRTLYRTSYSCRYCGHSWSLQHTEEYREPVRARRRKDEG
jgi:hypothetical protein